MTDEPRSQSAFGKRKTEDGKRSCAAVILAAGEALRMGSAKPALPFGDGTMVGAVIGTARSAGLDPIVVVTGFHSDEVAEAVGDKAAIVRNPDPGRGNMSSLLVGLDAVGESEVVVVLLSDMPLIEPSTIEALCQGVLRSGSVCGWIRYVDGRGHPIAFTPKGIEAIGGLSGTKALWPWFDSLGEDERYDLVVNDVRSPDINTAHDYELLTNQRSTENGKRNTENAPR